MKLTVNKDKFKKEVFVLEINLLNPSLIIKTREILIPISILRKDGNNIVEGNKIVVNYYSKKTVTDSYSVAIIPFRIKIQGDIENVEDIAPILRANYLSRVYEMEVQQELLSKLTNELNTLKDSIEKQDTISDTVKDNIVKIFNLSKDTKHNFENIVNQKYHYYENTHGSYIGSFSDYESILNHLSKLGINTNKESLQSIVQRIY